ncbi:MarR family winged helix-turn-helix transcriptional regulator [Tissierella sp. Yu-01]|uniref:MarR family winged helix-turn-helix transcriptional regulator n=1 Tax=Tissierella sp. Yu-01 TaxID=3035694 RepID=UPI00240E2528|nr:MarR family winged helix-turn-helix transcriptional regulator [Tissierella sp. Yu-01]WFA07993.1 MarR family winged helix-turn-helix transcriptional regulator [Tissierella sp. Yu-01]
MIQSDVSAQIKEIYQKITQLFQHKIDEYGLNFRLVFLTIKIQNNPNASQKELAEQVKITQGAMSGAIKKLIKLKMIEQIPLESDSRYNRLVVTNLGETIINDYKDFVHSQYQQMFDGFTEEELFELHEVFTKLNNNLDNMNKNIDFKSK